MTKIKTYIDANVVINAWRGLPPFQTIALAVLEDPDNELVTFESRNKPMYKISPAEILVTSLHPDYFKIH